MKKKLFLITGICILLLLFLIIWFFSPGVRSIGPFFHCDIEETVWLLELDHDNHKLVRAEQATITVKGTGFELFQTQNFNSDIAVSTYPVPDGIDTMSLCSRSNDGWQIYTSMSGIHEDATPFIGPYTFSVTATPYQNSTLLLHHIIFHDSDHPSLTGIAAETPEKALALFNEYSQAYAAEHDAVWIPYS